MADPAVEGVSFGIGRLKIGQIDDLWTFSGSVLPGQFGDVLRHESAADSEDLLFAVGCVGDPNAHGLFAHFTA